MTAFSVKEESSIITSVPSDNFGKKEKKKLLNPMLVTGLTDAEGSFTTSVFRQSINGNKWDVKITFQIAMHSKEEDTLLQLKEFFGVGSIYKKKRLKILLRIM